MSRTLFLYIFKDLLRIFLLAVGVLSTIMTFGGLLRPLYEFGLSVGQVGQVISWSTPAMWAYSLPIAALYATTVVYGRLGADNETTACRAAGISHLAMMTPAFLLGVVTSILSLLLLCLVVPACTYKVEQIIYSNLAELIAGQIQRTHQIRFGSDTQPITVQAQDAEVVPVHDAEHPSDQAVRLIGPTIVRYVSADRSKPQVPEEFYMAREATAIIRQDHKDDNISLMAELHEGVKFPRTYTGGTKRAMQLSVDTTRFGPEIIPSPIRENTKFMDVIRLNKMLDAPENSVKIQTLLRGFYDRDQSIEYLNQLVAQLNSPEQSVVLGSGSERYRLTRGSKPAMIVGDKLVLGGGDDPGTPAHFDELKDSPNALHVAANEARVRPYPDVDKFSLDVDLLDCKVTVGDQSSQQRNFSRPLTVPMNSDILALASRPVSEYFKTDRNKDDMMRLKREMYRLTNSVISELWARVSFAVSCLVLVGVGCSLGMIFRSGNFLNAFAVSVVPALLSIALVVTGQHTAENVPYNLPEHWNNTLGLGIAFIVSGNAIVAITGVILIWRLQRQ